MKHLLVLALLLSPLFCGNQGVAFAKVQVYQLRELTIEERITLVLQDAGLDSMAVKLIVAQSKHESGNYKNSLTRKHNNVFARWWSKYDIYATGPGAKAEGHSKFARYQSIELATLSQIAYFKRKGYSMKWKTADAFAKELKAKGYYADSTSNYSKALRRHLNAKKASVDAPKYVVGKPIGKYIAGEYGAGSSLHHQSICRIICNINTITIYGDLL